MARIVVGILVVLIPAFAIAQVSDPDTAANPAPSQSSVTSTASPEVQRFQKILDSWDDAMNRRDQYALELVLSPLFIDVSASGDITTRNQQLATLIAGDDKTMHISQRVITVRMLGDTAVANGTYVLHHKSIAGGQVDEKGVFTQVFERTRSSSWVCLNSQRTLLREDSPSKGKKQSTAEMPFHIPLFSKTDKEKQ